MRLTNTATAYGSVARILHWAVALLIMGLIGLGWWMVGLSYYDRWYNASAGLHKAVGMLVMVLGPVNVLWYLCNRKVVLRARLSRYQRSLAHAVHALLLLLMVLIPVSGYLISTSSGDGVSMFGLLEVPSLAPVSPSLRDLAIDVHFYASYAAAALVLLHSGAALKHQFIDRDGTLRRMLW